MSNETKCPECGEGGKIYCGRLPCGSVIYYDGSIEQSTACKTIQALKSDNEAKDKCLGEIMNLCIGDVAMGYRMDGVEIGQMIYDATGKNAEQFRNPTTGES